MSRTLRLLSSARLSCFSRNTAVSRPRVGAPGQVTCHPSKHSPLQPEFHKKHCKARQGRWHLKKGGGKDLREQSGLEASYSDTYRAISESASKVSQATKYCPGQSCPKQQLTPRVVSVSHQPCSPDKEALSATRPNSQGLRVELTLTCFLEAPSSPVSPARFFPRGASHDPISRVDVRRRGVEADAATGHGLVLGVPCVLLPSRKLAVSS
jgi:hypothetical protein